MSIISAYVGRVNTPQNAEFIALYQAIINGGLAEPEGSGKAAAATATVSNIAENVLSKNSYLAQSVLAVYTGADYVRHGIPVRTNLKYNATFPDFDLTPNPANNTVSVLFRKPITQKCHLQIYHLSGQLVKKVEISPNSTVINMNIENMAAGVYFCRLSTGTTTSKLVVIK